jgi:hypothetical protein
MGIAAAGVAAVGGIVKGVMGAKQASKARKAIDSYQRQDLTNIYEDLSVSTKGAELQREELARATATSIGALQQGGIRGVLGGIGKVQEQNIAASRQIGADLDIQQKEIERLQAGDEARIQQITEQREQADLAGLGQQLSVGQQNLMGGIGDIAGAASAFAGGVGSKGAGFNYQLPKENLAAGLDNPFTLKLG